MAYNYDKLYATTPNALGEPTDEFVRFFDALDATPLRVLDVGCGQGRDAVFIARRGHSVVAVDLSPHGVRDVNAMAKAEGLDITGQVADLRDYQPDQTFDVVLIDRTLHMLSEPDRLAALARLVASLRPNGWLLIADEVPNMAGFLGVIKDTGLVWHTEKQSRGYLFLRRTD